MKQKQYFLIVSGGNFGNIAQGVTVNSYKALYENYKMFKNLGYKILDIGVYTY